MDLLVKFAQFASRVQQFFSTEQGRELLKNLRELFAEFMQVADGMGDLKDAIDVKAIEKKD